MSEADRKLDDEKNQAIEEKNEAIQREVYQLFSGNPDWVTFFREVLGRNGLVRRHYPSRAEKLAFEATDTYKMIQYMLTKLRENAPPADQPEPTRVITVRLPKSVHEALRVEAHEHETSMNKLCISKLLQYINDQFVPEEL